MTLTRPLASLCYALLLALSWNPAALANCSWKDGLVGPARYSAPNSSLTVNSINTAVGQRVGDIGGMDGTPSWKSNCSGSESAGYSNLVGATAPAIGSSEKGPIYNITTIPGIGYSLSDTALYNTPNYFRPYGEVKAPIGDYYFDATSKIRVDFWKTGNMTTGQYCLPAGTLLGNVRFDNLTVVEARLTNGLCVNIVGPTCTVSTDSKNITVPLGTQQAQQFTGIGSSSASRNFNIHLQSCSNVYAVLMQFNASADPDYANAAQQGVIQLQAGAQNATGIGVQLLNSALLPQPLNNRQEVWRGAPASNLTLPFAVRYLQTRSQVTPGQANALVQFVVAYQ
ncbi:type 1 fimbrial protein [Aeromonas caviae]|uniref:Type 1 fimbrial protein n=1 Tax=Aeromonas caviae TaxID=648 RepID=A0AA42RD76_AERCA|nr:fimbrial protein [Aeromonas caviae]MDH1507870.1 type 1 fimbrial protein [Aeromonas caviae]MDH1805640.1 type 1 fimbrial protein [Aeromonas caviae]RWT33501.1 hypothetical protein DN613_20810 [Aeromonas caviae]